MMIARLVTIIGVLICCTGCAPFIEDALPQPESPRGGDVVLGLGNVKKKGTIELEGHYRDGRFVAKRIEIQDPDDEVVLKGVVSQAPSDGVAAVGGVSFQFDDTSRFESTDGESVDANAVQLGSFCKAECHLVDDQLVLRKLRLRVRRDGERDELQGPVSHVDLSSRRLEIEGVPVDLVEGVVVVWDGEDEPQPDPMDAVLGEARGLRRVRVVDDDNWRPESQFRIGDWLTIGGEVQFEAEWRNNHNLRDVRDRDRLEHQLSTKLEFSAEISRRLFAFSSIKLGRDIIHFDEGADRDGGTDLAIEEAFALFDDLVAPGFSLQVGRQDFDHGREWVMDDQMDGIRAWLNLDPCVAEVSVSRVVFDPDPEEAGITNYLIGVHGEPFEDWSVFLYYLRREGGDLISLGRNHMGVSIEGEWGPLTIWLDLGHSSGREAGNRISGYGVDFMLMVDLDSLPGQPYAYAGIAWGSGEKAIPGATDRAFRQTGLQDNTDRLGGVTSFRYLGEVMRPELSNMLVLTAGLGMRLSERTSLDLVWHHYRQDVASPFLRDTRLRLNPNGTERDLGNAYELILGLEDFRPMEMELVLGWFVPGSAFRPEGDAAMFLTFQIEWNF